MSWTIRRLGPEDAETYRAIRLEALRTSPASFGTAHGPESQRPTEDFAQALARTTIFGGFGPTGIVGTAGFYAIEGDNKRHRGTLFAVYAQPQMRGTGLARALVEAVIDHARAHVEQITLNVVTENQPAIRLYRSLGFETYGTEPRALRIGGRYYDQHLMVRFLAEGTQKEVTR